MSHVFKDCPRCGEPGCAPEAQLCGECETKWRAAERDELERKVRKYNRTHNYSLAEVVWAAHGPYIKIHTI
jgi:hypothetical protein